MKYTIGKSLAAALLLLACGATATQAQTTNATPPTPDSFVKTVENYFTSFDTNLDLTFGATNYRGSVIVGADYVQSVNISSSLGISYDIGKGFSAESTTRNAGIAGVILSQQAGIGYNLVIHDLKITGFIEPGYDFNSRQVYGAIGARLSKALTTHTFAGIGLEEHIGSRVSTPILSVFTGFTF